MKTPPSKSFGLDLQVIAHQWPPRSSSRYATAASLGDNGAQPATSNQICQSEQGRKALKAQVMGLSTIS